MKKIILAFILCVNILISAAWADTFVVQRIEVQGLQRISSETVNSYLPIRPGQQLNSEKTAAIIRDLYKTGFFERITLDRRGNTLIINVQERPTIGKLDISGNSFIPTDKLTTVMKSMDIAEGRVYNRVMIERIKQSLLNQYYELGRYNARVDVTVTPMSRNRMLVKIDISEGLVAKIRRINIIGNHAFSEARLDKQMTLTTPGLLTFITQSDRYTQEKLEESLDNLRNFYLDHGYIKFTVKSSQVAITPDRKSIYLTIVIDEGLPYKVKGLVLTGNLILPREQLMKLVKIKPGDTFSRQAIIDAEKSISNALGDKGYVFATVSLNPNVNDTNRDVFLTFDVKPGKRTYVRHIYFSDNAKTNDEVLRREIQQMESAVVSTGKLDASKHQLSLLPYVKDVQMTVLPVKDSDDQVDVNYKVTEDNSANVNASIGYSQNYGVQLGAGFNQKNFLGTGKTLGINLTRDRFQQFYGLGEQIHDSTLSSIAEDLYRSPDVDRAKQVHKSN
jgi:outer membrane protein insertion porin family